MQDYRRLYGTEKLGLEDLIETGKSNPIKLDYYKVKEAEDNQYSVEIVKTEYFKNRINKESKKINLYTDSETKTDYVLEILKRNKVTPIGLYDTMIEISKIEKI